MSDPLSWSINVGRWAGVRVRLHLLLLLFVASKLVSSLIEKDGPGLPSTAGWLLLLGLALAAKLVVQAFVAASVGFEFDEVRVWPLGHLNGPGLTASERSREGMVVAASGLATSAALAAASAFALAMMRVPMVSNPFGNPGSGGAPIVGGAAVGSFSVAWWVGWFGYLNWVLLLVGLIPALPLDGGRIIRPILAARSRDGMIGPWTAHSCAAILLVIGLVRWLYLLKPGGELVFLALLIEWMVRLEARSMEEGSFLDDGVFGYDFSQGYTSLEAGAATVRPPREGAIQRWRRRRDKSRRLRLAAEEEADERRMDAILDKIHREGRSALSEEETRFLVRVSDRLRKRVRGS